MVNSEYNCRGIGRTTASNLEVKNVLRAREQRQVATLSSLGASIDGNVRVAGPIGCNKEIVSVGERFTFAKENVLPLVTDSIVHEASGCQ